MNLLIFARRFSGDSRRLLKSIRRDLPEANLECQQLTQRPRCLSRAGGHCCEAMVAVAENREDLFLVRNHHLLHGQAKLILILGATEPEMLRMTHALSPSYFSYREEGFGPIVQILSHLKRVITQGGRTMGPSGDCLSGRPGR